MCVSANQLSIGLKAATVERVRGSFDDTITPGVYRRCHARLSTLQNGRTLGHAIPLCRVWDVGTVDVRQQIHQITRPLYPISDRLPFLALIRPVRLLSWLHQGLRHGYLERGEQQPFPAMAAPQRTKRRRTDDMIRLPGEAEKVRTLPMRHE